MVIHLCHSLAQLFVAVSSSASGVTGGEKHLYRAIKVRKRNNSCDKCLHPSQWSCNIKGLNASRNLCYISTQFQQQHLDHVHDVAECVLFENIFILWIRLSREIR